MTPPFKLTHPPRRPGGGNAETPLVKAILETFGHLKGVEAWRTNSGAIITKSGRPITMNPPGCGDISGVVWPWGVHFECEVKRYGEKQRDTQRARQALITLRGGIYFVAHDTVEARDNLNSAIASWLARHIPTVTHVRR